MTAEPPLVVGAQLESVLVGPVVTGHVTIWKESNERSTWQVDDSTALAALLGRGQTARTPVADGRFRETALVDFSSGTLLVPGRWRNDEGQVEGVTFQLSDASTIEPVFAVRAEQWRAFSDWMADVVEAAAARGDFVVVERGGYGAPHEPYVLAICVHPPGQDWLAVVECAPAVQLSDVWPPHEPHAPRASATAPASTDIIRAGALLIATAAQSWAASPHELGVTFGKAPAGPLPTESTDVHVRPPSDQEL